VETGDPGVKPPWRQQTYNPSAIFHLTLGWDSGWTLSLKLR